MRHRWILASILALAAMALWVSAAFADNGPHGGYSVTTDGCASCHRAHTASGAKLLKATSTYALCTSCHNGAGATTDVLDGVAYNSSTGGTATTNALKGGGFTSVTMTSNALTSTSVATAAPATSDHQVVGMTGYSSATVWGMGAISGTGDPGPTLALQCTSCHDPHGKAGTGGVATYRLLRSVPDTGGVGVPGAATIVPDPGTKVYTITNTAGSVYYGQVYPDATETGGTALTPQQLSSWCAECHTRIHATGTGSGSTSSGDAIYNYRHRTDGSNFGVTDANGAPACLTCHVAHGSKAASTGLAATVPVPGATTTPTLDSSLLRLDNRGVCEACHNK